MYIYISLSKAANLNIRRMSKHLKPDQKQLFNKLAKDFHDLVNNKQILRIAVENFLSNIIDEMTLGIIFDLHRKYKTNAYDLDVDDSCDEEDSGDVDVFAQHNLKKIQDCMCLNCDKSVAPETFAKHLQTCMGLGGRVSRNASRRVVYNNSDRDNSAFEGIPSDDDKDDDWNSGDRRKKKKEKAGRKKNRGTPRKIIDMEPVIETLNVDVEGDEDDLTNLRAILYFQDHSNSTSPADSASSSSSTKKKEKSKSKKNSKRDKSPAPNISNK